MTAPICTCLHHGETDRPYALVTINKIPWTDRMPDKPGPRTFSLCEGCAKNIERMLVNTTVEQP